jgi:hypothetical protein
VNSLLAPAATLAGLAAHVVAQAVWAPSVHNTQPWWFSADPAGLSLYADPARQLAVADPDGRQLLLSCGAALFTARLALRAAGWIPEAQVTPPGRPPDARLTPGGRRTSRRARSLVTGAACPVVRRGW